MQLTQAKVHHKLLTCSVPSSAPPPPPSKVVRPAEQRSLAVRWILAAAAKRKDKSKGRMSECLALELLLAYQKKGDARQKRDDLHKLALENKANAVMRWW